jgi:hypothetical protein
MKTIVAGSRDGVTLDLVRQAMLEAPFEITSVVSGTARGADRFGEKVAHEYSLPVHRFPADWDRHGRSAGYIRNAEMAGNAEALVAVHAHGSKGTQHMIDLAQKKGLQVHVMKT